MGDERAYNGHSKNAPGPFYVVNDECIACQAPEQEAPDVMAHVDRNGAGYHCYFKRQPTTAEELEQAILSVVVSCCGAVRYAGSDPEVLRRISEWSECRDQCDALIVQKVEFLSPSQLRGRYAPRDDPMWDGELDP